MESNKIEDLMKKLEENKAQLARDRENLNMSRAQYALFRKIYLEMRKASDEVIDSDNPLLRLKMMYLKDWKEEETEFADCNTLEVLALKKRFAINKWAKQDMI